jgi:hypothetical protein
VSHTLVAIFVSVLCEVCAEAKETIFVIETECVLCEVQPEADKTIKNQAYSYNTA